MTQGIKLISFLSGLLMIFPVLGLGAPPSWDVEGIFYEENAPDTSVVVVNGVPLLIGEEYDNHRIQGIDPAAVRVLNIQTGEEHSLAISGKRRAAVPAARASVPPPAVNPIQEWWQGVRDWANLQWANFQMLFREIEKSKERPVLAAIQQIRVAAWNLYSAGTVTWNEVSLKKLVETQSLPRTFEDGILGNYRFELKGAEDGFSITAEPVEPNSLLRYYLYDEDGTLYAEKGKSATRQSQICEGMI